MRRPLCVERAISIDSHVVSCICVVISHYFIAFRESGQVYRMKKLFALFILSGMLFIPAEAQSLKDGVYLFLKSGETLNEKHLEVICVLSIENGLLYSKFESPEQVKDKLKQRPYCYDAYSYIDYHHGFNLARGVKVDHSLTTSKRIVYTYRHRNNPSHIPMQDCETSFHDMHFAISLDGSSLIYWMDDLIRKRSVWFRIQPKDLIPYNEEMDFLNW